MDWAVPLALCTLLLASTLGRCAQAHELLVVGTPHLSALQPAPTPGQRQAVVDRLAPWRPTLVCVEAMPPADVAALASQPQVHGAVLEAFASEAVRTAPPQQLRLRMGAEAARAEAMALVREPAPLDARQRTRLIALQLAAHDPHSALLNWLQLTPDAQAAAPSVLGRRAVADLQAAADSRNEIVTLAIPLALQGGHRRLCSVDPFVDEVAVQHLAGPLQAMLGDPRVEQGLRALQAEQASHWRAEDPAGLRQLLHWLHSADFESSDRQAQWDVFVAIPSPQRAGLRRLALWHARNAQIAAHVYRALADADGARVLLLIGAAHRPFIEQAVRAQPWMKVHDAARLLAP